MQQIQTLNYRIDEQHARVLAFIDGQEIALPALWLRERCQDSENVDETTRHRLFDPHQLEADLALTHVEKKGEMQASLTFSDGYSGDYDLSRFNADFDYLDGAPVPRPWKSDIDKAVFHVDYHALRTDKGLIKGIEKFLTYGVIIVDNVPQNLDATIEVAEIFGHVRETNFGKSFEVYSRPNSSDLAYRSVPLGPHTDNPYRDPMPGIQLLHCLQNQAGEGLSTLVDSLSVLKQLKHELPDGYKMLCEIPVRFRHFDSDVDLVERRTIIESDASGNVTGIAYSPRLDHLPLLNDDDLITFHTARRRLGQLLSSPEFEWKFCLQPGQLQMFHNTRVLHGRTGFDPNKGLRHLHGAYIDYDAPKGRYKLLKQKMRAQ